MNRVLVTGANGFVGRAVVQSLAARGFAVVAALRREGLRLPGAESTVTVGDIETANWDRALDGVDCVVHLAARVHQMDDRSADPLAAFRAVNRDATMALARAAADRGVKRFIFLSSVKAALDRTGLDPANDDIVAMPKTAYGISKREAERRLLALGRETSLNPVILRPPLIYGPGVKGNFRAFVRLAHHGLPAPLAGIRNRRSLLGLGNLTNAIAAVLMTESMPPGPYFIADAEALSTPELLRRLAHVMGKSAHLFPVPPALLRGAAAMLGRRAAIDRLTESLVIDSTGFIEGTGWRASVPMEAELERVIRSLYPS